MCPGAAPWGGDMGGAIDPRRRAIALAAASIPAALLVVVAMALAPAAVAETFIGPSCTPGSGPPGTVVRMDHFPFAAPCERLRVFVSTGSDITDADDPRLIELTGLVTAEPQCITSVCASPTPGLPVFTFVIPDLDAAPYFVYAACDSAFAQGWTNAGEVLLTVEPLPPGATPPPSGALPPATPTLPVTDTGTGPAAIDEPGAGPFEGVYRPKPLPDPRLLLGCLAIAVVAAAIAGNHLQSRDDPGAPGHRRHRVDRDRRGGIHLG